MWCVFDERGRHLHTVTADSNYRQCLAHDLMGVFDAPLYIYRNCDRTRPGLLLLIMQEFPDSALGGVKASRSPLSRPPLIELPIEPSQLRVELPTDPAPIILIPYTSSLEQTRGRQEPVPW